MKSGIGAWLVLASLVGMLVFAIFFMVVGWNAADIEGGQEMTGAGYVAMTFGIIVTIALGSGLMALVFYSNRSGHDEALNTQRRYTLGQLCGRMGRAGFRVRRATYANGLLLGVITSQQDPK